LSIKRALKTLKSLGLTETEAQVYVFLAKKGPHNEDELAFSLKTSKDQVCTTLEMLVAKQMVLTNPELSVKYSAIALEKILDQFMKARKKQAKALRASRSELLSIWRSMMKNSSN
jgi:sugar-specific transcriptional regulator TrmB